MGEAPCPRQSTRNETGVRFGSKRTPVISLIRALPQVWSSAGRERSRRLPGERIGTNLEVHGHGRVALAALGLPGRAVAATHPQSSALPAGIRIIDAAVDAL